ncbi:phytase [Shewanella sp. Scap07]|uniref:phytase n=1 Tax=Shewanella sp. Scap07 TaxID=2589987 RepID=UPI0015BD0DB3|nr:phytase [Shewanella sp. Scap07]QLE83679.1 phytase [Shewanella sp. Scap07]
MKTINKYIKNSLLILSANSLWLSGFYSGETMAASAVSQASIPVGPVAGSQAAKWRDHWLLVSEKSGLTLVDNELKQLVPGQFEYLDTWGDIALTYDMQVDQVQGIKLDINNMQRLALLPKRQIQIDWLCLQPRAADNNLYAWIGNEEGQAEQWLLMSNQQWQPQLLRSLSVAMGALTCTVDSNTEQLYVVENQHGVWQYPAAPNSPAEGKLVLQQNDNAFTDISQFGGKVLLSDSTGQIFNLSGKRLFTPKLDHDEVESFAIDGSQVTYLVDADKRYYQAQWAFSPEPKSLQDVIAEIPTQVESAIADRAGDTMDDPAIWVHPTNPSQSRILGTNKRWGLLSFDMQGQQVQQLAAGRVNNVDIRQRVKLGGQYRDIAVASNRDRNSLSIFEIDAQGHLTQLVEQATKLTDIYGLCLYQPDEGSLYAFANDKSGVISQLALTWDKHHLKAEQVQQFKVPTQPEGCVADDQTQRLFVGEENAGIWLFDLSGSQPQGEMILAAGGPLVADIEGLDIYHQTHNHSYLVVSSQGNDSYVLYDAQPPFDFVGRFRIGVNGQQGHDGSAETDGLAVTSSAVGAGVWSEGMLVVQDGRNRLPDEHQNFKWVPWRMVQQQLALPSKP